MRQDAAKCNVIAYSDKILETVGADPIVEVRSIITLQRNIRHKNLIPYTSWLVLIFKVGKCRYGTREKHIIAMSLNRAYI